MREVRERVAVLRARLVVDVLVAPGEGHRLERHRGHLVDVRDAELDDLDELKLDELKLDELALDAVALDAVALDAVALDEVALDEVALDALALDDDDKLKVLSAEVTGYNVGCTLSTAL